MAKKNKKPSSVQPSDEKYLKETEELDEVETSEQEAEETPPEIKSLEEEEESF